MAFLDDIGARSPALARVRARLEDPSSRGITVALLAASGILVLLLGYWLLLVASIPTGEDLRNARFEQATIVFAADGTELTRYQDKNRKWVALDEISPSVVEALLSTEDHRFYEHWGIDIRRTLGATMKTLGGDMQGGSTITMQLARNAYPEINDDWMLHRKVKEWITALRLEAMYSKEEILEMYLNTVPFMYNAFGIEAASETYFQIPASQLNVKGAATLVGMLKGTVYYNPVRHPERSHERRNVVLNQMVKYGYLTEDEFREIEDVPTQLDFQRLSRENEIAPHFAEYLRAWLDEWAEKRGHNLYTDGLRVHTTIDPHLQQAAQQAADDVGDGLQAVADVEWSRSDVPFFSGNADAYRRYRANVAPFAYFWERNPDLLDRFIRDTQRYRTLTGSGISEGNAIDSLRADTAFMDSLKTSRQRLQIGLVAVEPSTGFVRAWVGGREFGEGYFDHVAQARRQPGSTFKPFVYAAALEQGFSPADRLVDRHVVIEDPQTGRRWTPQNAGGISGQSFTLSDGLAYSKNTITAQLMEQVGPRRVVEVARRMGIESELAPYPSLALGTSEVTLLELAGAYTTLANSGRYQEPIFVTRIENADGRVLDRFTSASREALAAHTAYSVLDMMRGVVDFGTGAGIRSRHGARGDLAGKTGTTQGGADGWFMLMHPNLVVGSWVGFTVPAITFRSSYWGQGAHTALDVVGEFYGEADLPDATFNAPPGYRPPARRDTTLLASYPGDTNSAYLDSLEALSDSLVRIFEDPWGYEEEDPEQRPDVPTVPTEPPPGSEPLPETDLDLDSTLDTDDETEEPAPGTRPSSPDSAAAPPPESGGESPPPGEAVTGGGQPIEEAEPMEEEQAPGEEQAVEQEQASAGEGSGTSSGEQDPPQDARTEEPALPEPAEPLP